MNGRRPEQVHYVPPGRRKHSITVVPSIQVPAPPPPPSPPVPVAYPASIDSPTSKHSVPVHPHLYEPTTLPPPPPPQMRPEIFKTHSHSRPVTQRRDSYDLDLSPPRHRRGDARVEVRLRSTDSSYDRPVVAPGLLSAKYATQPTHLSRNRSYEEQYMAPPSLRRQATAPEWIDGATPKGSPVMHKVRILRNPERERERERNRSREEHARAFATPPRPPERSYTTPTEATGYIGDNIHSLTPSTSLEERVRRFVRSLNPDQPDPPEKDGPYEHPPTKPDPHSAPPDSRPVRSPLSKDRAPRTADFRSGTDFFPPKIMQRETRSRRPKHRGYFNPYDSGSEEECVRRGIYRLHT